MGHYLDMNESSTVLTLSTNQTIIKEYYAILCDAVTKNCWGWDIIAKNVPNKGYSLGSLFGSGLDTFSLSSYYPINVNFKTTHMAYVSITETLFNYGFDPHYWIANDHQIGWPQKSLAYRFQNF